MDTVRARTSFTVSVSMPAIQFKHKTISISDIKRKYPRTHIVPLFRKETDI